MGTTATPIPWGPHGRAVADRTGLDNGPWLPTAGARTERRVPRGGGPCSETIALTGRRPADKRRSAVKPLQRLAAVIWDSQFLRVQHAVYRAAPRLAVRLDELARRRDEGRGKRS